MATGDYDFFLENCLRKTEEDNLKEILDHCDPGKGQPIRAGNCRGEPVLSAFKLTGVMNLLQDDLSTS